MFVFVVAFWWLPWRRRVIARVPRNLEPQCSVWGLQGCLAGLQTFKPGGEACIQRFVMQFEPVHKQVRANVSAFV